jgi:hypothetical protein
MKTQSPNPALQPLESSESAGHTIFRSENYVNRPQTGLLFGALQVARGEGRAIGVGFILKRARCTDDPWGFGHQGNT